MVAELPAAPRNYTNAVQPHVVEAGREPRKVCGEEGTSSACLIFVVIEHVLGTSCQPTAISQRLWHISAT